MEGDARGFRAGGGTSRVRGDGDGAAQPALAKQEGRYHHHAAHCLIGCSGWQGPARAPGTGRCSAHHAGMDAPARRALHRRRCETVLFGSVSLDPILV